MEESLAQIIQDTRPVPLDTQAIDEAFEYPPSAYGYERVEDSIDRELLPALLGVELVPGAVGDLVEILNNKERYVNIRTMAAQALGEIGSETAPKAVDPLIGVLEDTNEKESVRNAAAKALVEIGSEAVPKAVDPLIGVLEDTNEKESVRNAAAKALGEIGPGAAPKAIDPLLGVLEDANEKESVRRHAAETFFRFVKSQYKKGETRQLALLKKAYNIIDEDELLFGYKRSQFKIVVTALQDRKNIEEEQGFTQVEAWVQGHPLISLIAFLYATLLALCLILLGLGPLWLLAVNQNLKKIEGNLSLEISGFRLVVPLRQMLIVGFFHFHPRVLNAWVMRHLDTARENFRNLRTVSERAVHVPLPAKIDGELTDESFSPADMQPVFSKNIACVVIRGEGGSGKTSLACQMGRWAMRAGSDERLAPSHPMLPVLVEEDFDDFLGAVNVRLQDLIDEAQPVAEDLLLHLLRQRRVLVIVDHLSELSGRTREAFQPGTRDFPANALIITSRTPVDTGRSDTVVEPLRIESDLLFEFMGVYLKQRGYRREFKDSEFGPMVGRLSTMVGEREVTVGLAKLYAEQMIAVKEGETEDLPESIPELMLRYVNWLNREAGPNDPADFRVQRLAKPLAWRCVQETYRPGSVKLDDAHDLLEQVGEDEAILDYFKNELRLIQPAGPAADQIQYSLDPLAEYLAALHVVDKAAGHEEDWRRFIEEAESKDGAPEAVKGFLLAVRDCCIHDEHGKEVPDFVPNQLAARAGLDPEEEERLRREQRVRRLIGDLSRPAAEDRKHAAKALCEIGSEAVPAVDALSKILEDESEDISVRVEAAEALGHIGPEAAPDSVDSLTSALGCEQELTRAAAEALGRIGPEAAPTVDALSKILEDESEDMSVRIEAAEALGQIGPEAAPTAVDPLTTALDDESKLVSVAAKALGQIGPEAAPTAVDPLIGALSHETDYVISTAIMALGQIGPAAVEPLSEMLWSEKVPRVNKASRALGQIGSEAAPAARDTLVEALNKDESTLATWGAVQALRCIGPEAAPVSIDLFTDVLNSEIDECRTQAVWALGEMGPPAIDSVVKALTDDSEKVRAAAAWALGNIKGPAAVNTLLEVLGDESEKVRREAIRALGEIGPEAAPDAIDPLIEVIWNEDLKLREMAGEALGKIGPAAVDPLLEKLGDESEVVRNLAALSLVHIGTPAVVPLIEALRSEDPNLRIRAARGLGRIAPEAAPAANALREVLEEDESKAVREAAAKALKEINSKS